MVAVRHHIATSPGGMDWQSGRHARQWSVCSPLLRSCARPVGDGAQHVVSKRLRPPRSDIGLPFGEQPAKHGPLLFLLAQQARAFANDVALVAVAALGRFVLHNVNHIVRRAHFYRRHVRIIPVCQLSISG